MKDVQKSVRSDTKQFVKDNFTKLQSLALGGKKAAKYKQNRKKKCYKTVFDDASSSSESDHEDEKEEMFQEVPRNALSSKKGEKYAKDNEITYEDFENLEEVPLTVDTILKYLPKALELIETNVAKKVASSVDDVEERR